MAVRPPMAAVRFPARTRPRWTARPPTRRAISPRTSWPPGLAKRCTIQLSYAIGVAHPLSIYADTHGTGEVPEQVIEKAVGEIMDLTPRGIRTHLQLNRPIYQRTAAYGHFGRAPEADGGFSWERTDLAAALKAAV
jgi:S-adenosylmethionine synthetase